MLEANIIPIVELNVLIIELKVFIDTNICCLEFLENITNQTLLLNVDYYC